MTEATTDYVLNTYLYGVGVIPEDPALRLRPSDPTPVERYIDTTSYMGTVGRFATLASAQIVADFFDGNLSRALGTTDSNGVTRLSIAELSLLQADGKPPASARFSVSQYAAGINDDDFAYRAFIWGETSFVLSPQTTFVWDANGDLTIEDGSVRPYDTDFDFLSGSRNPVIQPINDNILKPVVDPYGIGKTVKLMFGEDTKLAWDASHIGNVFDEADFQSFARPDYVFDTVEAAIAAVGSYVAAYTIAAADLAVQILSGTAVDYTDGDRDIIYGTNGVDVLDYSSHINSPTGAVPFLHGATFVGGEGNDVILGGNQSDRLHGGAGNDILIGGSSQDWLKGGDDDDIIVAKGWDYVEVGSGEDIIWANDAQVINIKDGDANDSLYWKGFKLIGGDWVVVEEETMEFALEPEYNPWTEYYVHATHMDIYGIMYDWYSGSSNSVNISLPDGTSIWISDFVNGDFGIFLEEGDWDSNTPRGFLANNNELVVGYDQTYSYSWTEPPETPIFQDNNFGVFYGQFALNNIGPEPIPPSLSGWI